MNRVPEHDRHLRCEAWMRGLKEIVVDAVSNGCNSEERLIDEITSALPEETKKSFARCIRKALIGLISAGIVDATGEENLSIGPVSLTGDG